MKPIPQEAHMGCAVACAASLSNLSYKKMRRYFDDGKNKECTSGFYNRDIIKALSKIKITAKAFSIKKWSNKKIKLGTIVFIRQPKVNPFGHYILKTKKGWMNPWINFPYINPAKAGFQKILPGQIKWVITINKRFMRNKKQN